MTFKNFIKKAHLWLGLSSGLIVIILGITGCLYVFEEELRPIVHDYYYVDQVKNKKLPISQLIQIATEANKINPKQTLSGCRVLNDEKRTAIIWFFEELDKDAIWYWNRYQSTYVYLDPYSGSVKKLENYNFEFFVFVRMLHQTLCFRSEIGDPIVGTATIIFIISLITGLILWWPKNKQAAKQRFWFRWKNTTQWKRKNYDLHNILGYYMMFFALIIALTGLVWAFECYDKGVQWLFNGGKTFEKEKIVSDTTQYTQNTATDKIYATTIKANPNAKSYYLFLPKAEDSLATFQTFVRYPSRFDDVSMQFDRYTGKNLKTITYSDKNNGEKFRFINYDLHVGSILGFPGKILAFFASLVSASLPITGFLIWWGRNNKKKKAIVKS
ncbi:PepSY-associated TM helix domain-containing protein [Flavobacterium sp. LHD-80]|uniref:PepSY-associated TM helix domain-containing protein n=1 Tax=Flavobacterium sp. LHD-80 TaxID=3071411 RepID=UPI0027E05CA1|nr:PepSY-associated TM helix domain-containing protein [Flavobacterium sp. LHD-80]MDQ6469198.1 PepSY-associated TM helix domain-containing protein [Flavobacterium sp. LHD-80]